MTAAPRSPANNSAVRTVPTLDPALHYHFLGIGGIGMSALAHVLAERGIQVSGSDAHDGPALRALAAAGVPVRVGHSAQALRGVDVVIYSSAIREGHPVWEEVTRLGLPRLHRAELLGALAAARRTLAVTGTHGKTTSTAALAFALAGAGRDASAIVGGHVPQWQGRNYRTGADDWLVCEADESDGSFIHLAPEGVLLTNVEEDHLDFHGSLDNLLAAFRGFLDRIRPGGALVYCREDAIATELATALAAAFPGGVRSYGYGTPADVQVRVERVGAEGAHLALEADGTTHRLVSPLIGRHNALNLAGAFALATATGAAAEGVVKGLAGFQGVARRQQFVGRLGGLAIYDDYAHHPTELRATLESFRAAHDAPLTVVFQPHLYSRTARFAEAFAEALRPATQVYVTEVYGAREAPVPGVSGRLIVDGLGNHPAATFLPDWREFPAVVRAGRVPDGLLLTLGAGDITDLGPLLLRELA